jgi:hypothetical protein
LLGPHAQELGAISVFVTDGADFVIDPCRRAGRSALFKPVPEPQKILLRNFSGLLACSATFAADCEAGGRGEIEDSATDSAGVDTDPVRLEPWFI